MNFILDLNIWSMPILLVFYLIYLFVGGYILCGLMLLTYRLFSIEKRVERKKLDDIECKTLCILGSLPLFFIFIFFFLVAFFSKEIDKEVIDEINKKHSEYSEYFYFYNLPYSIYNFVFYPHYKDISLYTSLGFRICSIYNYDNSICTRYLKYFEEKKLSQAKEIKKEYLEDLEDLKIEITNNANKEISISKNIKKALNETKELL